MPVCVLGEVFCAKVDVGDDVVFGHGLVEGDFTFGVVEAVGVEWRSDDAPVELFVLVVLKDEV